MIDLKMRKKIINAMSEGLVLPYDIDVNELTFKIWEEILKLPHAVNAKFNLYKDAAIIYIKNNNKNLIDIHISNDNISFMLSDNNSLKCIHDKRAAIFATLATIHALDCEINNNN